MSTEITTDYLAALSAALSTEIYNEILNLFVHKTVINLLTSSSGEYVKNITYIPKNATIASDGQDMLNVEYDNFPIATYYLPGIVKPGNTMRITNGLLDVDYPVAGFNNLGVVKVRKDNLLKITNTGELAIDKIPVVQVEQDEFKLDISVDSNVYTVHKTQYEDIINTVYPVGSLYITLNDLNPSRIFNVGEWQHIADGRCLWGAEINETFSLGSSNFNSNIVDAKLPLPKVNDLQLISADLPTLDFIAGGLEQKDEPRVHSVHSMQRAQVFQVNGNPLSNGYGINATANTVARIDINHEHTITEDEIYSADAETVLPPAFKVHMWVRIG